MEITGAGAATRSQSVIAAANAPVVVAPAAPEPAAPTPASATAQESAQVKTSVANINKILKEQALGLEFSVDEEKQVVVKVVDQDTGKILRQIPSEEAIEIAKALEVARQGLLVSQKV